MAVRSAATNSCKRVSEPRTKERVENEVWTAVDDDEEVEDVSRYQHRPYRFLCQGAAERPNEIIIWPNEVIII